MRRHRIYRNLLIMGLLTLAAFPFETPAMWARLTDSELMQQSQSVVIGELIGQTELVLGRPATKLTLAVIRVNEVLKGDRHATVMLLELPSSELRSSSDITYRPGQSGAWFLRLSSKAEHGIYLADHPQRFQTLDQAESLIKVLRNQRR